MKDWGELWELLSDASDLASHQHQAAFWESPTGQPLIPRDPWWDPSKATELQELLQRMRIFFFTL